MSAQTPQTDAAQIDGWLDGADDVYGKGMWVAAEFARTLEVSRDHYKALCEELREALKYARRFMKADSDIAYVDIAVMKADHALKNPYLCGR